jgi:hypothetical protein
MQAARAALTLAAPGVVRTLCRGLLQAVTDAGSFRLQHTHLAQAVHTALRAADWSSEDGKHVLYRLLTVMPFPAVVTDVAASPTRPLPLTRALGELFDSVVVEPRWLRTVSGTWTRWASGQIVDLAREYRRCVSPDKLPASADHYSDSDAAEGEMPYDDDDNDDDDAVPTAADDAEEDDYLPT